MLTAAAGRAAAAELSITGERRLVVGTAELSARGVTRSALVANLSARRWQRVGRAIVLHSGNLSREQRWGAALVNCGPRSVITGPTAARYLGLDNWDREEIQVLVPTSARKPTPCGLPIRVHRTRAWPPPTSSGVRCHELAPAVLIAAAGFESGRPGCGLLAAAVQQRLLPADALVAALIRHSKVRHHRVLLAAAHDIAGGSQALSEIDFVQLCRAAKLPLPDRQAVRRDPSGRRRYLDASWRRADGRLVVVEVDGALHLSPRRWWDDQLRQNELVLTDALVLRFPSVVVRTEPAMVIRQLRQALQA